ncbi:MAG: hypothetical protein JXA46_05320 [Dehalococcoidales bacterium]|nr:hypothetical protein [Dehalococcoidales bacterium]
MEGPKDRHTIGGVLSIVSGVVGIIGAAGVVVMILFLGFITSPGYGSDYYLEMEEPAVRFILVFYIALGILYLIISVLAVVGGVFSLKKKHWGLALAGAIAGSFIFYPCGIAAIVFVSLAKPEFSAPEPLEWPAG